MIGSAYISLSLPSDIAEAVEAQAAKLGQTAAAWIADRLTEGYGAGRLDPTPPRRRRMRSAQALRRQAARLIARADARDAEITPATGSMT